MPSLHLSDDALIERVRRARRYRRPLGAICLLVGLLGMALLAYWTHNMMARWQELFDELARSPSPTTQQFERGMNESRFLTGFGLGCTAAAFWAAANVCAVAGVVCLVARNRKDDLLLKCWDDRAANR
jgi:hypothetical protein